MKILLADDHTIVRNGLRSLLENDLELDIKVIGEAENGLQAVQKAEELCPDLVIMDIMMSEMDGIQATDIIRKRLPKTEVIILSMYSNASYVKRAIKAGAKGFIIKDDAFNEIQNAIEEVSRGKLYLSPSFPYTKISFRKSNIETEDIYDKFNKLTPREKEVFMLTAIGNSRQQISEKLYISMKTVDQHRKNIKDKLDADSQSDIIKIYQYITQK
ncbi:MAG: response regulator transcription factor [Bacteroidales bacterium]|nr:response regulator transcription factor [Bacteroidales bacterium]